MKKLIEQSYVCRLRTLARKSIIGFGSEDERDLSVQMLIDSGKIKRLIGMYFKLGKVSFHEDILNEIGITEELRINKPGKLPKEQAIVSIYKAAQNYYKDKDRDKLYFRAMGHIKRTKKREMISNVKRNVNKYNVERLRGVNHGNFRK